MSGDQAPALCWHRVKHEHGTRECYGADRCRCTPCRAANAIYARRRRKLSAWGRTPGGWVDAAPVRAHVARLRAAGLGRHQIAERANIGDSQVHCLINGRNGKPPTVRVAPRTAQRLLAVPIPDVDGLAPSAVIDGTGTRRRLHALIAVGWSQVELAEQLGWARENLYRVVHGYGGGKVMVTTRRAIVDLYDRLWNVIPPDSPRRTRALAVAATHGWSSPLAWDDDTIDDPTARPNLGISLRRGGNTAFDEVAVQRAMRGDRVHLRPVERAEVVRRLTEASYSAAEIADCLGVAARSVVRHRTTRPAEATA